MSKLPVYATLSLCTGPILFLRSFQDFRLRRLIQNTPTARIRSMAMGLVELNGTVESRSNQHAPFSGRPCAFWEVEVAVHSGRNGWATVHRNASGNPFFLRDDTGLALVYPSGARGGRSTSDWPAVDVVTGLALPDCYADYMRTQRLFFRHMWRLGKMRFRERYLEEGERVYVLGTATPRARATEITVADPVEATGTDGAAFSTAPAPRSRVASLDREVSAVVRRGESDPVFIISTRSERDLTLELGLATVGKLVLGPALTLFGLGYWLYALSIGRLW